MGKVHVTRDSVTIFAEGPQSTLLSKLAIACNRRRVRHSLYSCASSRPLYPKCSDKHGLCCIPRPVLLTPLLFQYHGACHKGSCSVAITVPGSNHFAHKHG